MGNGDGDLNPSELLLLFFRDESGGNSCTPILPFLEEVIALQLLLQLLNIDIAITILIVNDKA